MIGYISDVLQTAVYARLSNDAGLAGLIGPHVYDAIPAGPLPDSYVLLGEETVLNRSDQSAAGARHDFAITLLGSSGGFLPLKQAAAAVCRALDSAPLMLSRGQVVSLNFINASAKRTSAGLRKIELRFSARLDDIQS